MGLYLGILATVVTTSLLSGVLGMAGGLLLMAVLVSLQGVATAMIIHGVVQAAANGSRTLFLLGHVHWRLLPSYLGGALVALGLFMLLDVVPDPAAVLLGVGAFPWLALLVTRLNRLDVTRPLTAVTSGVVVTAAQLFAGASGPALDVFYLNAQLDRYQVVATKALTQTLGHGIKLGYYGLWVGLEEGIPGWFLAAAVLAAIAGTRIGTALLGGFGEAGFRRVTGWVVLTIGAVCIARGLQQLLAA